MRASFCVLSLLATTIQIFNKQLKVKYKRKNSKHEKINVLSVYNTIQSFGLFGYLLKREAER